MVNFVLENSVVGVFHDVRVAYKKSGMFMLLWIFVQLWFQKQLASMIAVKCGYIEHFWLVV